MTKPTSNKWFTIINKIVDYFTQLKPRTLIIFWLLFLASIGVNVGGIIGLVNPLLLSTTKKVETVPTVIITAPAFADKSHIHPEYSHRHIDYTDQITNAVKGESIKRSEESNIHIEEFHGHR